MRKRKLISFLVGILLIISSSCNKKDNICVYEDRNYADTSLSISFYLDGVFLKYYQMYPSQSSDADGYEENSKDGIYVIRNIYRFRFSKNNDITLLPGMALPIDVTLCFYKWKQLPETADVNSFKIDVNEVFAEPIVATKSTGSADIDIMRLMDGYSLNLENGLSTDVVFYEFEDKPEYINTFFNTTFLNITKVENICNNSYLIEGSFETKTGKLSGIFSTFESAVLTNGKFRILRKFEP
jgi:hypothetical protein